MDTQSVLLLAGFKDIEKNPDNTFDATTPEGDLRIKGMYLKGMNDDGELKVHETELTFNITFDHKTYE